MKPPSVQLLRTLRHANIPRCYSSAVRTLICPYQDRSTSRTLRAAAKNPATHINAARTFITVPPRHASPVPRTVDRGPPSKEDTQTDFGTMNVLGNTPAPTTAIDACLDDGFHLDNGLKIIGGCGCILVSGEAFSWRPWEAGGRAEGAQKGRMINKKGQWDVEKEAWGVLDLMWPKPGIQVYSGHLQTSAFLLTRFSRSFNFRVGTLHISHLARNEETHQLTGYTRRYSRHQECSGPVQSSCYRTGCRKHRRGAHSHRVERAKIVIREPFKRTPNELARGLLIFYDD